MKTGMPCPFNSVKYLAGLSNIGQPVRSACGHWALLKRDIHGTGLYDGVGPWPYLWVESGQELESIREAFSDLVTLTIVTQPGFVPELPDGVASLLKTHFVYDPSLPLPPLSKRAQKRLIHCEARARLEVVTDFHERIEFISIYRRLISRRQIVGCYVDFPDEHFTHMASLRNSVFFRVSDVESVGAVACGVVFNGMLQVLHMASSDEGLRWNASYLLMRGMQDYVRDHRLRLLIGGIPDSGSPSLETFKRRWVNWHEPVYILKIINDETRYRQLCTEYAESTTLFPAYRSARRAKENSLTPSPDTITKKRVACNRNS